MKNLSAKAKAIYDLLRNRPTSTDENGTYCTYPKNHKKFVKCSCNLLHIVL